MAVIASATITLSRVDDGDRGTGILKITTAPSSYTTTTGGFTPTYRVALSTVISQSKATEVKVGDVIQYNYYQYPVGYVDSSYVYCGARTSIRGASGATGATGERGTGILKITTAPSSYTTTTGEFTPTYRIALSTVKSQSGVSKVLVGDVLQYNYYQYKVGYVDSSYVYTAARTSIRGATGAAGATGSTGVGVSAIVTQYYISTSSTSQTGGSWKTTQDGWSASQYLWTRSAITWTDGTTTYTDPVLASTLNTLRSDIDQAVGAITLTVTGADGQKTSIKIDDGTIDLTGEVLAQRIAVASLVARGLLADSAQIGVSGGVTASFTSNGVVIGTPEGETPVYNFYLSKSAAMAALLAPNINIAANGTTTIGGNIVDITGLITKLPAGTKYNGTLLSELFAEKAPAGYGLGPAAKTVDSWDNALGSGFYQSMYDGPLADRWFYGLVHSYDESGEYVIQKVWTNENGTYSTDFSSAERRRYAGTWGEWEWVNPPMVVGVEYRTTERHQGNVVYVQTKSYGTPVNGGAISFGSSATIIRHSGELGNSLIPYGAKGDTWYAYTNVYSGAVHLICSSNFATSAYPWTHTAWYTKD